MSTIFTRISCCGIATHYIGASTKQAQIAVADGVVEVIAAFVDGKVANCMNAAPDAARPGRG